MPLLQSDPQDAFTFWKGRTLFADKDGDGYPDHMDLAIVVSSDLTDPHVWVGVLNLVARIAFEVIAFRPPLVIARRSVASAEPCLVILPPGRRPPSSRQALSPAGLWRPNRTTAYVSGSSGEAMMALLNTLATSGTGANSFPSEVRRFRRKKTAGPSAPDLLNLAGPAGLYHSDDPRIRRLDAVLQIDGKSLSTEVALSLCDFVARMVLEATDITLPMAFSGEAEGSRMVFRVRESNNKPAEIRLIGEKRRLPPRIGLEGDPRDLAKALRQWAPWAFLDSGPGFDKAEAMRSRVKQFREFLHHGGPAPSGPKPEPARALEPLRLRSRWKAEGHKVLELAASVPGGTGKLTGEVFVSKPLKLRRRLRVGIDKILRQKGYDPEITVLNAYKPGLSWLMEEILPELEKLSSLHTIELGYQPFAPAAKALEMKSRWLQELFPGPELVARSLGLDQGRIRISRRAGQKTVYEIRALNSKGKILFRSGFSPVWRAHPYLLHEPKLGFVHPTTGGIKLRQANRVILDGIFPTDRETFWSLFQKEWLPLLEKRMAQRIKEPPFHGESAFWKEIRLDVSIDETDERLALGDERICPMEALHEDLYFVLLDAFSSFSKRHTLPDTLHLGRIVPQVLSKAKGGIPFARLNAKPLVWGRPRGDRMKSRYRGSPVSSLTFENGKWGLGLRESASETMLTKANSRGFNVERVGKNNLRLWVKAPRLQEGDRRVRLLKGKEPPLNRLLKAKEVSGWIERLGRLERISVWQASHSLQGRPLWVLEAVLKKRGSLMSLARMRLLKPTFLFNARHHANEVSSTNATLWMAWILGTTPVGKELLKHVNVAWIPLENPDGVATLEELLPYGRDHKLHAARYNALGVETYGAYFDDEPRFPEALAKARLWRRWLPDVMVDHHGVPSHEWDQPFSGYAPFRFREFWIPRNFVYACIPFVNEPGHAHHRMAKGLGVLLGKAMSGVAEIVRRNGELSSLYRRYARGPEPDTFPGSKGEPLLVLPPLGRTYRTNFAVRYPHVTRSEIILEVPDEGSSKRHLELCVQAHLKAEEALLHAFRRTKGRRQAAFDSTTGLLRLKWVPGVWRSKIGA